MSYNPIIFYCTFLFISYPSFLFSQMAGIYTVGGESPDYYSLSSALSAIKSEGTSDTVIFNLRDGIYNEEFRFEDLIPNNLVIVQSENLNAEFVEIIPFSWFEVEYSKNLMFKQLYINSSSTGNCMQFNNCTNITIDSCILKSISNSVFTLSVRNHSGQLLIKGNTILNGEVKVSDGTSESYLENNTFYGEVWLWTSNNFGRISNNYFGEMVQLPANVEINGNTFNSYCYAGHKDNIDFHHNHVFGTLSFGFCDNLNFYSNVVFDNINLSGNSPYVSNNHFHQYVSFGYIDDHQIKFHNNNFRIGAFLQMVYYPASDIRNNNFSEPIRGFFGIPENATNLTNNNYYPGFGIIGLNSYHYDPQYLSQDSLIATNPLLIGKGEYSPFTTVDMNNLPRPSQPTLGSNEYCIDADTINIKCGDHIRLRLCGLPEEGDFQWSPNINMDDPTLPNPLVSPNSNITYTVVETNSGTTKSITIIVSPFVLELEEDQTVRCGFYGVLFQTPFPYGGVTLNWSPADNILNYGNGWYANPLDTTKFILTLEHDNCGTFIDSITINIDPIPYAQGQVDTLINYDSTVTFFNLSYCEDSVKWFFGDGNFSTLENPTHTYDTVGNVFWKLIAINEYGVDSTTGVVFIDAITNVDETSANLENKISVFPNPNSGNFNIEFKGIHGNITLKIFDLQGQLIQEDSFIVNNDLFRKECYLKSNVDGMYLIQIHTNSGVIMKKIIYKKEL